MTDRGCSVDGCLKPHRAKGLCATHYNRQHQPNRHRKVMVACTWCKRSCLKDAGRAERYGNLFCSLACRDRYRAWRGGALFCRAAWPGLADQPAIVLPPPAPLFGFKVTCKACGKIVWRTFRTAYCADACEAVHRLTRLGNRFIDPAERQRIYERDGGRCGICKELVPLDVWVPHPLAFTIDHVIPRSEGGDDEPANLRPAHFLCNSTRGDRGGNEQLMLIG